MREILALAAVAVGVSACGAAPVRTNGRPLEVAAAESSWGSIAAQLGGGLVHVTSVIGNPSLDPHEYEPTARDARAFAAARMVIVNGAGYDPWASRLLAANPVPVALDVGKLVGVRAGGNPHLWYSPAFVRRVVGTIAADYRRLDPKHARFFRRLEARFETRGLARYEQLIATIRQRYRGVAVGASESIFVPLAQALGLRLVTPSSFLRAISEGTEPTAADKATIDRQVARREIEVWVVNGQNTTPDVARITDAARANGIPVTAITETLSPATATFQAWQSRQLEALAAALRRATGR